MSKIKTIEREIEIKSINDIGKFGEKKKGEKKKSEESNETEALGTVEERVVSLRLKDGKIRYSLNIAGKKSMHPLEHLDKLNDIGLKAQLTLKISPNPQKTLDDIS